MGLMMCEGRFVSRNEIAMVPTPAATVSWKPVAHTEAGQRRSADVRFYADQPHQFERMEPLHRHTQFA